MPCEPGAGSWPYQKSFWALPYRSSAGGYFQVPFMSGAGGNTVFLAPNGVSTFVFTDHGPDTYSLNSPAVAETIRPFPDTGLDDINLIDNPARGVLIVAVAIVGVAALGAIAGLLKKRRSAQRASRRAATQTPG